MLKTQNELGGYNGDASDFPTIDMALAGEQSAYEKLFKKYREKILKLFWGLTKYNITESEDFVQDTFASAFLKLHTFKKSASFYTWLYRIAVNIFLMSCRRKKHHFVSIEELQGGQIMNGELIIEGTSSDYRLGNRKSNIGKPDRMLENVLKEIIIGQLMRNLPPGCKNTLELHDLQGLKYKEVAVRLGCSLGNAKSQRHRALMKLRAAVQIAPHA